MANAHPFRRQLPRVHPPKLDAVGDHEALADPAPVLVVKPILVSFDITLASVVLDKAKKTLLDDVDRKPVRISLERITRQDAMVVDPRVALVLLQVRVSRARQKVED